MDTCDRCEDMYGGRDPERCERCTLGNPCYGCEDYSFETHRCTSDGGCSSARDRRKEGDTK